MERCPEIGFDSYDRFFPNQNTRRAGDFGNLIALPLQRNPREQGAACSSMNIFSLMQTGGDIEVLDARDKIEPSFDTLVAERCDGGNLH